MLIYGILYDSIYNFINNNSAISAFWTYLYIFNKVVRLIVLFYEVKHYFNNSFMNHILLFDKNPNVIG